MRSEKLDQTQTQAEPAKRPGKFVGELNELGPVRMTWGSRSGLTIFDRCIIYFLLCYGLRTTLMQLSCLSRKTLYISGPFSIGMVCVMTNDGSIWPSSMRRTRSSVHRFT